ncbi:MAG: hypothetical protein VBE63_08470 [Lamprobacter sp.]|uniref:hypothetical protein n=1 Tax=Lamprobacter sp. TaxID=3100796 RepID=UPI002B261A66|nr:hypothetical protein [Lamprobacter sp.]MEA3639964.1 hypothetical protein [Lamprobacter sp.]
MNVYELVEKVGGEIVRGRARYRPEGQKWVELGRLNGDSMEFTPAGTALRRELDEALPKRPRRLKKSESDENADSKMLSELGFE